MALMTYFQGMMNGKPVCPVSGRMVERLVSGAEAGGMNQEQALASLLKFGYRRLRIHYLPDRNRRLPAGYQY